MKLQYVRKNDRVMHMGAQASQHPQPRERGLLWELEDGSAWPTMTGALSRSNQAQSINKAIYYKVRLSTLFRGGPFARKYYLIVVQLLLMG